MYRLLTMHSYWFLIHYMLSFPLSCSFIPYQKILILTISTPRRLPYSLPSNTSFMFSVNFSDALSYSHVAISLVCVHFKVIIIMADLTVKVSPKITIRRYWTYEHPCVTEKSCRCFLIPVFLGIIEDMCEHVYNSTSYINPWIQRFQLTSCSITILVLEQNIPVIIHLLVDHHISKI